MGITNSQYDAIMRVYEKRRTNNHHVEEERRKIAYEAIPELLQLDRAVASLSVQTVRESLSRRQDTAGEDALSPASLHSLLRDAASGMDPALRRRQLLTAHGFPEDYLDPVYTCKDCRDTGRTGSGHCHCFDREVVSLFYTQSHLSGILQKENFQTFRQDVYRDDLIDETSGKSSKQIMTAALQTCRQFADDYGSGKQMDYLLLSGAAGLGKTFLSHCIAKELIDKGHSVIYYSAGDLFDTLARNRFGGDGEEEDGSASFKDYLLGCDLLIIDDLGTELTNSFVGSALFELLTGRIARSRGVVISTNLSPGEIGRIYSDRISSRIIENFTLIRVFGEDIRILKRIGRA